MSHIFISYSRKDIDFAQKIVTALAESDLDTWIDWKSIPKGEDWEQEIYRGIEEADAFLFLISPASVASEMCNKEILHAVQNNKRILPIVIRDANLDDFLDETAKTIVSKLNWVFCRAKHDRFGQAIEQTRQAIHTNYEWLKYHTKLQIKALDWERTKDPSRLLRGKELQEAELQLTELRSQEDPQPTILQREYVLAGRRNEERQRRRITSGLVVGVFILVILSLVAWGQRNSAIISQNAAVQAQNTAIAEANARATAQFDAENKARIARARELSAESVALRDQNFMVSLLLGIEGYKLDDNPQTRGALIDNSRASPQLRRYLTGHAGGVQNVAFSPDGETLASADGQGHIILWDAKTGASINKNLTGYQVSFSPTGRILASSGGDESDIILWDVATGQPLHQPVKRQTSGIRAIAFSPDGQTLASGDMDSNVILWDVATGQALRSLIGHTNWVFSVTFSPDGKILASAGADNNIILWDTVTWQPIRTLTGHTGAIQSLAFTSDGKILASGSNDTTIVLWNVETGLPIGRPLSAHSDWVFSVAFSPDDRILVSGSADTSVLLWDVASEQVIGRPLSGHNDWVRSVDFAPDGVTLVSGSQDSSIILWSVTQSQSIYQSLREHTDVVWSVKFSPDGKILASGSRDGNILLWDPSTGQRVGQPIKAHDGSVNTLAFSPDGKILASGGDDYNIILWDVATGRPTGQPLIGHKDIVLSLSFSLDGKILASGGDTRIILWDVKTRRPIGQPFTGHSNWVYSITFSPDGKMLASGSWDGSIILWDMATGQPIGQPLRDNTERILSVVFSPNGKTLVSGGVDDDGGVLDNSVAFWDIASGQLFAGHTGHVSSVSFSPDGNSLASTGGNNNIILWDATTNQPIGEPFTEHTDWINSIAFSPDGNLLASGGADHSIILWHINPSSWVENACQRVGRNLTHTEWIHYLPDEPYRATCPQWPLITDVAATQSEPLATPAIDNLTSTTIQNTDTCDDFDTTSLNSRWLWVNPLNDALYSLTENPGYLRLRVSGQGHDLYQNLNAPRMVQTVTGDFKVETKVTINPVEIYQGAGLLLWQDENNYVRLERTLVNGINWIYRIDGNYQTLEISYANSITYLQMQLMGERLTSSYSEDGLTWTEIASVNFVNPGEKLVGLDLINEWQDATIQADFDYFYLGDCK